MAHLRRRFWIEVGLGATGVVLLVLTVAWPDWIEVVFGADPDGGNGALEWAIVTVVATCALTLPLLARLEWRRAHTLPAADPPAGS